MINRISASILAMAVCVASHAAIVHTNTESLTLADCADGSFTDFRWNWAGYDSEAIVLNYDTTLGASTRASFRMRRPKDGTVFKEVLTGDITVSTTQLTFSVAGGTNMVPVGSYWAEVITYDTATNVYRTVAQGMINVNWSLFKDDDSYFEYYTNIHSLAASLIYHNTTSFPGNVNFSGDGVYHDGTNFIFTGVGTGAVASVFGRTGVVTANSNDYATFYSGTGHVHAIADVTGLQAALDGKASTSSVTTVQTNMDAHEALTGTNVHGLGALAIEDDAPIDGSAYVRQDGAWTNAAAASGYVTTNQWINTNLALQTQIDTLSAGAYMHFYEIMTNASEQMYVLASTTNVTASRSSTTITMVIPTGTVVTAVSGRWNTPVLGATFTLVTGVGTNIATQIAPVFQAYREDNGRFIATASATMDMSNFDRYVVEALPTATICKYSFSFPHGK